MGGNLNYVALIGNLCADPEQRVTASGKNVTSVSLATNETYTDQGGQKQTSTEYHRLVFWNKLSEIVSKYCTKGSSIWISGKLQTRKWTDSNGVEKYTTEIVCREMQMLDSKKQSGDGGGYQQRDNFQNNQREGGGDFMEDD